MAPIYHLIDTNQQKSSVFALKIAAFFMMSAAGSKIGAVVATSAPNSLASNSAITLEVSAQYCLHPDCQFLSQGIILADDSLFEFWFECGMRLEGGAAGCLRLFSRRSCELVLEASIKQDLVRR